MSRVYAYVNLAGSYEEASQYRFAPQEDSNIETSVDSSFQNPGLVEGGMHLPVIDLDIPHTYRPSTTPGHGHLLLDVAVPWDKYVKWLELSAELGFVQEGWVRASKARGFTSIRKEGVYKTETEGNQ